jgi:hypothetical protein
MKDCNPCVFSLNERGRMQSHRLTESQELIHYADIFNLALP